MSSSHQNNASLSGAQANAAYVVLARKWRPAQFSDIVGQGHIVRTLMNAIRAQRIHQAYLFTGSRGIGKTSIARIYAKVIRCENTSLVKTEQGEWLRSCDTCPSCKEIAGGNSIDVIEIDGASNNGVDAVREIRENAKFLPATGSRKIYIIDEVHMLTTAAFNALLKTLEEPPAHVIFIFATTEPHKIPATILSRCQRFDYRRVTVAQIQTRITEVIAAEGIQAEPGALALIARAAEGSMRDALSLLDQVIAFSGNHLTASAVRESIGLVEGQTLLGILTAIFARKPLDALALVDQAYQRGHDLRVLTRGLIEFLHGAILTKVGASVADTTGLELSEEEMKELKASAGLRELEEIEMIFQVLHQGVEWIARSPQPKIVLDVLLVKCATAEALVFVDSANSSSKPEAKPSQTTAPAAATKPATPKASASAPAPMIAAAAAPAAPAVVATPQAAAASAAPTPAPAAPRQPSASPTWEGLIEHTRNTRPLLASILEHGYCAHMPSSSSMELTIAFQPKDSYFRDQLQSRAYQEQVLALTKDYFGGHVRIQFEVRDATGGESMAARKQRETEERQNKVKETARNHPMILEAKALFGGDLGPIELVDDGGDHHA